MHPGTDLAPLKARYDVPPDARYPHPRCVFGPGMRNCQKRLKQESTSRHPLKSGLYSNLQTAHSRFTQKSFAFATRPIRAGNHAHLLAVRNEWPIESNGGGPHRPSQSKSSAPTSEPPSARTRRIHHVLSHRATDHSQLQEHESAGDRYIVHSVRMNLAGARQKFDIAAKKY